jgi:K(+)-stimulated pyrophosphate-energized sodium pump
VALNPIIKFTTLFGLLAVETAVANQAVARPIGIVLFLVALVFVYRSFYGMRIGVDKAAVTPAAVPQPAREAAARH